MSNKILIIISVGFVAGIFIESFLGFGFAFSMSVFLIAGVLALIEYLNFRKKVYGFNFGNVIFTPLFLLALALGIFRMAMAVPYEFPLDKYLGQKVSFEGIIYEEPDVRENSVNLKVKVSVNEKDLKILIRTGLFPAFSYGDKVKFSGFIKRPEKFQNENGGYFDYPSYLSKDSIYYIVERATVSFISSGNGNWLKENLFKIKHKFIETVGKFVPEPESSFLSGLVVGGKQSMGKEWLDRFQRAGVMHVVVLSGYNITIVAESVIKFFSIFLSQILSMVFGSLAIILFAIMTGGSATVVRASIMALIVILARATGRKYVVTRALVIAGVLMILQNPAIVAFDPSFQLSFMATIALIYVSPMVEERFKFLTEKWKIKEVVVSTISTQIFVLPLLLHMTGQFSIVGLLVNLLILIFIPMTMLFGFLAGIIGFVSSIISLPFGYVAYALLAYELSIIRFFSSLSFASISLPALSGTLVILIYIIIAIVMVLYYRKKKFSDLKV